MARFCGISNTYGNFFTVGQSEAGLRVRLTKHGDRMNLVVKIVQGKTDHALHPIPC